MAECIDQVLMCLYVIINNMFIYMYEKDGSHS